ncbi:MAG: hypothetical protein A2V77_00100 [Anaeromyxobacter sp. RBG_16_69_14]|nr:MAG: hypothetical protein A2V77_00100 [Anaeromyxobacter sp. RBG_16_69_14]
MTLGNLLLITLVLAPGLRVQAAPARVQAAPVRVQPPPVRIGISADPRQLELVPGARAKLRIAAPETPVVAANVGEIETLRSLGKGVFEATYVPPRETYPQVAIITATAGRSYGWLTLPLAGTGEVSVKAGPSGDASLTIGSRRFGPQRAGPDGRALIHIVVPPGSRYALAGGKRMNLNTPDVSHVHVTVGGLINAADGSSTALVRAFAVMPDGKTRRKAPLQLTATVGELSAAREVDPGVFECQWNLPLGAADTAVVEARLGDESMSISRAALQADRVAAPQQSTPAAPRRLRIDVERPGVVAGEGALDFMLVLDDGAGNPVDDADPRVSTSVGTLLGLTRGMPGRWTGHVSIPERLEGDSKLVIVASSGDQVAKREVNLLGGPAADLTIRTADDGGGGRSPVTFAVATTDRFGNPTDDAAPKARAALGKLDAAVRRGVGLYHVVYHPPAAATASRDEVTIRAGSAERVTHVPLHYAAQSRLDIAPKGGIAKGSGAYGPAFGAQVSLWTQIADGNLGLVLDGTWFRFATDSTVSSASGPVAVSNTNSYLAFTAAPAWRFPLGSRAMLWASLGAGLVRVQNSSTIPPQKTIDDATWVGAGTAAVSLGARMWGGYPFLEVRASYVGDPKLTSLKDSFIPVLLQLGYRFDAL